MTKISLFVFLFLTSVDAFAFKLSIVGAGMRTSASRSAPSGLSEYTPMDTGYGGGVLTELGPIEAGVIYVEQKAQTTKSVPVIAAGGALGSVTMKDKSYEIISKGFMVPILYRNYVLKFISFGIGAHVVNYFKKSGTEYLNSNPGVRTSNSPEVLSSFTYGLTGSFAVRIPVTKSFALLADTRYNFGLKNTDRLKEFQFLTGISF